jgi:hypothetical protein
LIFLATFSIPLFVVDLFNETREEEYVGERLRHSWRVAAAMSLVIGTFLFAGSSANAFIYFQF